jgi:hypothetical protein
MAVRSYGGNDAYIPNGVSPSNFRRGTPALTFDGAV